MKRTPRTLVDARGEPVQIQEEFTRLQKQIEVVRFCVTEGWSSVYYAASFSIVGGTKPGLQGAVSRQSLPSFFDDLHFAAFHNFDPVSVISFYSSQAHTGSDYHAAERLGALHVIRAMGWIFISGESS